ncbi:hypothetical protein A7975_23775 [Bacillus sp. FJAT-26390]|nr:hypothetical protein A7975_23775 [Bacillus sp. FJAT-26390]
MRVLIKYPAKAPQFRSAAAFVEPQADRAFVYMRDMAAELMAFAEEAALPVIFGKDVREIR